MISHSAESGAVVLASCVGFEEGRMIMMMMRSLVISRFIASIVSVQTECKAGESGAVCIMCCFVCVVLIIGLVVVSESMCLC